MKKTLCFLFFATITFAQESQDRIVYMDSLGRETTKELYFRYRVYKDYYQQKEGYVVETFDKNGKITSSNSYKDKEGMYPQGSALEFYPNGNKKSLQNYHNSKLVGKSYKWHENGILKEEGNYLPGAENGEKSYEILHFWNEKGEQTVTSGNGMSESEDEYYHQKGTYKNGFKDGIWTGNSVNSAFKFEETYKDGKLLFGESTNPDGTKNVYTSLEVKPEPKKGLTDFYSFIAKKFDPPTLAYKNKVKGRVILSFVVEKDGKITDIIVVKGLGSGVDEEAVRVLSAYEKWKPAVQKGRNVRCSFTIPIALDYTQ